MEQKTPDLNSQSGQWQPRQGQNRSQESKNYTPNQYRRDIMEGEEIGSAAFQQPQPDEEEKVIDQEEDTQSDETFSILDKDQEQPFEEVDIADEQQYQEWQCQFCDQINAKEHTMCESCHTQKQNIIQKQDNSKIGNALVVKKKYLKISRQAPKNIRLEEEEQEEQEEEEKLKQFAFEQGSQAQSQAQVQFKKRGEWATTLPIYKYREQFVQKLYTERLMICVAETGSGKTTQIPQFLGDRIDLFPKKIICTQPRAMAAMSIAQRVAFEYEQCDKIQHSRLVGYEVGVGQKSFGNRIMYLTEQAFVKNCGQPDYLKEVSVVIIDEAHERNLMTDIVLGICKIQLEQKPRDFYVVVASATIDPEKFLLHFDSCLPPMQESQKRVFEVEGRTFPVDLKYDPPGAEPPKRLNLDIEYVVRKTIEYVEKSNKHTLVFLPGQREIEQAIEKFEERTQDVEKYKFLKALPLYGGLLPEDQQKIFSFDEDHKDLNGEGRMVVFTTNVAETSLTVPGVVLVIDSGFAKEAEYDARRRMTVLELRRIAKSSANQRKGRAGRIEPGVCVRLYHEKELDLRSSITPEILRSSLDTVVLQLKRLNLEPAQFPFIDRPQGELIELSIALLTRLGCLDQQTQKITPLGQLYFELPFSPSLAQFAYLSHTQFNKLELGVAIASLLSAPGKIFFIGGADREEKQKCKQKIADSASAFDSDLEHMYDCYLQWLNQESIADRIKYAAETSLNNRNLQTVHKIYRQVCQIFKKFKDVTSISHETSQAQKQQNQIGLSQQQIDDSSHNLSDSDVIAVCLLKAFDDQLCQVIVPDSITKGVKILRSEVRAKLNSESCLSQATFEHSIKFVVAMSITKTPSGVNFVETLHPIFDRTISLANITLPTNLDSLIFSCSNVGPALKNVFQGAFQQECSLDEAKPEIDGFSANDLTCVYNSQECLAKIYGSQKIQDRVSQFINSKLKQKKEELLSISKIFQFFEGEVQTKISEEQQVLALEKVQSKKFITIKNSKLQNKNQVQDWLQKQGIQKEQTQISFFDRNIQIVCSNPETTLKILEIVKNDTSLQTSENVEESFGKQLLLEAYDLSTKEQILALLRQNSITEPVKITAEIQIKICNAFSGLNKFKLSQKLTELGIDNKKIQIESIKKVHFSNPEYCKQGPQDFYLLTDNQKVAQQLENQFLKNDQFFKWTLKMDYQREELTNMKDYIKLISMNKNTSTASNNDCSIQFSKLNGNLTVAEFKATVTSITGVSQFSVQYNVDKNSKKNPQPAYFKINGINSQQQERILGYSDSLRQNFKWSFNIPGSQRTIVQEIEIEAEKTSSNQKELFSALLTSLSHQMDENQLKAYLISLNNALQQVEVKLQKKNANSQDQMQQKGKTFYLNNLNQELFELLQQNIENIKNNLNWQEQDRVQSKVEIQPAIQKTYLYQLLFQTQAQAQTALSILNKYIMQQSQFQINLAASQLQNRLVQGFQQQQQQQNPNSLLDEFIEQSQVAEGKAQQKLNEELRISPSITQKLIVKGVQYIPFNRKAYTDDFLNTLEESISKNFPQIKVQARNNCYRLSGPLSQLAQASKFSYSNIRPVVISKSDPVLSNLLFFLTQKGIIDQWKKNLKLYTWVNKENNNLEITGMPQSIGIFMKQLNDEYEVFLQHNYKKIQINLKYQEKIYKNQSSIRKFFDDFNKKNSDQKQLQRAVYKSQFLEIDVFDFGDNNQIDQIVKKLFEGFYALTKIKLQDEVTDLCNSCKKNQATWRLSLCGHSFCHSCLTQACFQQAPPIKCPASDCSTIILLSQLGKLLTDSQIQTMFYPQLAQYALNNQQNQLYPCNTMNCNTILSAEHNFIFCHKCSAYQCLICQKTDIRHLNIDCQQFSQLKIQEEEQKRKEESMIYQIIAKGQEFVKQNWILDGFKQYETYPNPCLGDEQPVCKSLQIFLKGIEQLNTTWQNGFYAWHGTGEVAIQPICCTGWDTQRRSGQAYGRGEYFGINPGISHGYAQNSQKMILAYIINSQNVKHQQGFCYVVDNPLGNQVSYCLPVLVVAYGSNRTSPKFHLKEAALPKPSELDENSIASPWRYHWEEDGSKMIPYNDRLSQIFEQAYNNWKYQQGNSTFETPAITRYADDRPQVYIINFEKMIQQNKSTGYIRRIERRAVQIVANNIYYTWEYQDEDGKWCRYENLIQGNITAGYLHYAQSGPGHITIQFPGRPEMYQLDFIKSEQKNLTSNKIRRFRKC